MPLFSEGAARWCLPDQTCLLPALPERVIPASAARPELVRFRAGAALQDPWLLDQGKLEETLRSLDGATSMTTVLMSAAGSLGSVSWMSETISDSCSAEVESGTSNLPGSGTPDGCPERTEITD